MLLNVNRLRPAHNHGVISRVAKVMGTLVQMARPNWLKRNSAGEPAFLDGGDWLAGDASSTLSRTIRWADGQNTTLLWKLPSPRR